MLCKGGQNKQVTAALLKMLQFCFSDKKKKKKAHDSLHKPKLQKEHKHRICSWIKGQCGPFLFLTEQVSSPCCSYIYKISDFVARQQAGKKGGLLYFVFKHWAKQREWRDRENERTHWELLHSRTSILSRRKLGLGNWDDCVWVQVGQIVFQWERKQCRKKKKKDKKKVIVFFLRQT